MRIVYSKIKSSFKNIWNALRGIYSEIILVLFFIFIGFLVSILWWRIFR